MITFDRLLLEHFLEENKNFIQGARINKIQQPSRREVILVLRTNGESRQLYINIYPDLYHICFVSDENYKKRLISIPQKPPMFCMLLRKYLLNSRIAKISLPDGERILELFIETYNELGDKIFLCLAIELMGKHSNIILYNTDTNIILGCAHNVGADKSQIREVYGQIPYVYPPKQADNDFLNCRYGFMFSFKKSTHLYGDVNEIIDNYYAYLTSKNKFKTLKSEYKTLVNSRLNKVTKSLNEMEYQIKKNNDYDKYRLWGDLIMANLYNLKDYSPEVEVFDYENNCQIKIKLKQEKTLKDNANDFYKKYNKLKTAGGKLVELIEKQRQQKQYFEQLLYSINSAQTIDDLKGLTEELSPNSHPNPLSNGEGIMIIKLPPQTVIYIGKNNKQNDYIVSKLADEDDLWFHTKDCAGSHVLLKTQKVTDELILKCCQLAKQYSSASNSSKVGVIYTKRKYLRKPPKANLGYVTYKNEKEILID